MKTLDQLAKEVRALGVDIAKAEKIIVATENVIVERYLTRGKLIHEAYRYIEKTVSGRQGRRPCHDPKNLSRMGVKLSWCKKAGISFATARVSLTIFRSSNPSARYQEMRSIQLRGRWRFRDNKKLRLNTAREILTDSTNTFVGAFAIMVQSLDGQTPEEFMRYPSVTEENVSKLVNFLETALLR